LTGHDDIADFSLVWNTVPVPRLKIFSAVLLAIAVTTTAPADAAQYDDAMTLRFEGVGPQTPRDVAACLSKRSGVGLAVANRSYGRKRSFFDLFVRTSARLDPSKLLVNEVRHLEIVLSLERRGTRAKMYLISSYRMRASDVPIIRRCLGLN
jgi:hypothetical protein